MRRSATTRSILAILAILAASCGKDESQTPVGSDLLNWRLADACAGVRAQDLSELASGPLSQQRLDDPDRTGCVFMDSSGADRFSAALVYVGYDPRDLALLSPQQGRPAPAKAWQRQIDLDGRAALVVGESADDCQILLPLSGEQDGWSVRFELQPTKPAPQASACGAHLPLLQKAVQKLPDLLRAPVGSASAPPSADPASQTLADSCAQFRSAKTRAGAMTLPLLDAAGQPLSPDSAKAMDISKPAAIEGLLDSSAIARRLATRPLPAQLRAELKLYVRNADLFRAKLKGPLQTGEVYLRLALAIQVNEAKALTFCPAE